jgi:hypothetical protein
MLLKTTITTFAMAAVVLLAACNEKEDARIRPSVVSTNPISAAENVAPNNNVTAMFSEEMDASTITKFILLNGEQEVVGTTVFSDQTLSFNPEADLLPNTVYTATIDKSAINMVGSTMWDDYAWEFTTGGEIDLVAPTVTLTNPEDNEVDVPLDQTIAFTFSESIDQSTINASSFELKQGETVVAGEITFDANTVILTPFEDLEANSSYSASITTAVKDLAGNAIAAIKTITFTTIDVDVSIPRVNATNPLDGAESVVRNVVISVTFNEEMDVATINNSSFTLMQGTNSIAGEVSYNNEIATFSPQSTLDAGLTYTANISIAAQDLAGNALAADTEWSFTTTESSNNLATVDLGSSANYVILAKSTITNVPSSAITGDMGLSPAATSLITGFDLVDATGFATSAQVTGQVFAADMASPTPTNLTVAVEDMMLAYTDAAGRPTPDFLELATGSIGGLTLSPGLYKWTTTVTISDDVVISGGADDVWIFQISGDLSMSSAKNITLTGGAQAKNIFWQVAGSASIGTNSAFQGIILSMNDIIFQTEASLFGRALAQKAVILDQNAITKPE